MWPGNIKIKIIIITIDIYFFCSLTKIAPPFEFFQIRHWLWTYDFFYENTSPNRVSAVICSPYLKSLTTIHFFKRRVLNQPFEHISLRLFRSSTAYFLQISPTSPITLSSHLERRLPDDNIPVFDYTVYILYWTLVAIDNFIYPLYVTMTLNIT